MAALASLIDTISKLSHKEHVRLVSTFVSNTTPELQCKNCKLRYNGRPKKDKQYRSDKGCFNKQSKPVAELKAHKDFNAMPKYKWFMCPTLYARSSYSTLINMHTEWKAGTMAFPGAPADQPAKYIEAMEFIDTLVANEKALRQERETRINRSRKIARGRQGKR